MSCHKSWWRRAFDFFVCKASTDRLVEALEHLDDTQRRLAHNITINWWVRIRLAKMVAAAKAAPICHGCQDSNCGTPECLLRIVNDAWDTVAKESEHAM